MNNQLAEIQRAIEQTTQALEALEAAIDASDNLKIGAALYWMRQALKKLQTLTQEQQS